MADRKIIESTLARTNLTDHDLANVAYTPTAVMPDVRVVKIGGQSVMDRGRAALFPILDELVADCLAKDALARVDSVEFLGDALRYRVSVGDRAVIVDQPAAGASVQHHQVAVDRIDQRGLADTVFTGEDGRNPGPVPRDQLGGARVHGVDAAGQPIVGVGGDHPQLGA